jgi:glycosyltransferase involved in cell wall biosynthesis
MDRRAFAEGVEKLLRDKQLARSMGERGLEIVSRKYNFAEYVDGLENLFERVISEKREARNSNNHALVPA